MMKHTIEANLILLLLLATGPVLSDSHAGDDAAKGREMIQEGRLEMVR